MLHNSRRVGVLFVPSLVGLLGTGIVMVMACETCVLGSKVTIGLNVAFITQDLPYQILTDGLDLIKDEIAM